MRPAQLIPILEREFLSAAEGHHTPVMMWGPPGVGKSQMVSEVAARHGVPVIDIRLSQMEPSDLRGIPFRTGENVEWAIPAILPNAQRHGEKGILFLDEITSAPPSVSAAAYQLILDRRLGDYKVPPGWAIFAAGNRQGDRGVTYAMPAPLANRFSHFEVEANLDDWSQWAYENHIDDRLIGFLRFRPELLFDFDPSRNPTAFPTPRSWEFAHRALQKFGDQPDLLGPALAACVGQAAGIEFSAYLANLSRMPDLDAIVEGRPAEVPRDTDLQYAVAAALVARAIRSKNSGNIKEMLGHILDYAARFPLKEMGVMLVSDIHRNVGQSLFAVPQFASWANQVADIVLYE
ncbi:MAG: AAA family ATPase [Hydrogenophilaceae bacterium]|nr:AAA family ATPase [Hydrogenophilaceae bacterium]